MKGSGFLALLACGACFPLAGQMTRPCLPQGKAVTLRGTLALVDENGYRQWIALRPGRPLCTLADATDKFSAGADQIHEVQASARTGRTLVLVLNDCWGAKLL